MDGGYKSARKFPAFTTAQLKEALASGLLADETAEKMKQEIADRESGKSKAFAVPQV